MPTKLRSRGLKTVLSKERSNTQAPESLGRQQARMMRLSCDLLNGAIEAPYADYHARIAQLSGKLLGTVATKKAHNHHTMNLSAAGQGQAGHPDNPSTLSSSRTGDRDAGGRRAGRQDRQRHTHL